MGRRQRESVQAASSQLQPVEQSIGEKLAARLIDRIATTDEKHMDWHRNESIGGYNAEHGGFDYKIEFVKRDVEEPSDWELHVRPQNGDFMYVASGNMTWKLLLAVQQQVKIRGKETVQAAFDQLS